MTNKKIDFELTYKLGVEGCYVVYDNTFGWIAEHKNGHMCFMTHDRASIMQDDIDAVREGVLFGM
jgi:hypothetical protein